MISSRIEIYFFLLLAMASIKIFNDKMLLISTLLNIKGANLNQFLELNNILLFLTSIY